MKSTFSIFLLLPALLTLAACRPAEGPQTQETVSGTPPHPNRVTLTPAQRSAIGVETGPFRTDKVRTKIRANGVLDVPPQNMVSIHAPFGGFLKHTTLLPGTKVSRGQVVATVENPAFITMQQEYLEARSQADYLVSEFQRQTALAAENVNARKSLEKAASEYETMKARLAGSKAKLEMLQLDLHRLERGEIVREVPILSPITGYVTEMRVNIGSFVQPTDPIFRIADTGHLHAELTVYEQDITQLAIGQKVDIQVGNESQVRRGAIHLLGREVGPDRGVKVHVHLDEEDPSLIPGTFLTAQIIVLAEDVPTLPESAVVQFEGASYIFVAADGQTDAFDMVPIRTGQSDGERVEIQPSPSLPPDARIVLKGAFGLVAALKNTEEE
jgi:membrane fusion protein, heavy metal efflux system